jgi:hypothetical protein
VTYQFESGQEIEPDTRRNLNSRRQLGSVAQGDHLFALCSHPALGLRELTLPRYPVLDGMARTGRRHFA